MAGADQEKLIELMIKQELMIAGLYGLFVVKFPEYAAFWHGVADDERGHAELIKKLSLATENGQVAFSAGKVTVASLNAYMSYVHTLVERTRNDEFDLQSAVHQARDLEMGLIEKNFLNCFRIIDPRYEGLVAKLERETQKHIKEISGLLGET